jgi:hypothetical protein
MADFGPFWLDGGFGMTRWMLTAAVVAALGGALTACETATPYQPLQTGAVQAPAGGYSESKIEDNRWRVSFAGNEETPRAVVESDMLYRAAELTLAQGYDWFEAAQRHTDSHTRGYVDDPFGPWWGPPGFRHRFWGDPFWADDIEFQTQERFDASVEIVMRRGPKPADDPHAFDARAVVANLGPKIVRPTG